MDEQEIINWLQVQKAVVVKVTPNSKKTAIVDCKENTLYLAVSAPPEDGKANAEIERFLSKLSKKTAIIKRGHTGKEKLVQLK